MLAPNWLRGSVGFTLTDFNVEFVLDNRDVLLTDDSSTMTERQKDLCRADAMTIFLSSSNKSGEKKQDGNSSRSDSGESFTYRDDVQEMAIYLYNKWGEVPLSQGATIKSATNMW